jgi:hypothetical protein
MTLNLHARGQLFNQTISEWIESLPRRLPVDPVGMWEIVSDGRCEFELSGDDLTEFVRRCVAELVAHGAKPVVGGAGTKYFWIYQNKYGKTNIEIVDAVIKEWLESGSPDCDPGGLWFALPSRYVGNRE